MSSPAGQGRPESVRLACLTWALALVAELIHQITQTVMSVLDPSELIASARASAEDNLEGVGEGLIRATAYGSIALLGVINLLILIALAVALRLFVSRHRAAGGARRLLVVFSLYFALRGLLVFVAAPVAHAVPVWLTLLDGSLQLIVAVAAVLGVIFSGHKESIDFITPAPDPDSAR